MWSSYNYGVLVFVGLFIIAPLGAYIICRMATAGFYRSKLWFLQNLKEEEDGNGKERSGEEKISKRTREGERRKEWPIWGKQAVPIARGHRLLRADE